MGRSSQMPPACLKARRGSCTLPHPRQSRPEIPLMFELASTPRDLGEILVQGLRLGRLAFRRLFMLTSLLAFLGLAPTVCLVWGAGDAPISMANLAEMAE